MDNKEKEKDLTAKYSRLSNFTEHLLAIMHDQAKLDLEAAKQNLEQIKGLIKSAKVQFK
jgi:hypothetical protein